MNPNTLLGFGPLGTRELLIVLASLVFWIWMIVDCAQSEKGGTKVAWIVFIVVAGFIGAPLYLLIRKLPRKFDERAS